MNSFPEWEQMLASRHGRGAERLSKTKEQQWQINWETSSRFVWLSVAVFKAIWVFPAIREYMRSYVGQCVVPHKSKIILVLKQISWKCRWHLFELAD